MEFEFDAGKSAQNLAKHGIDFSSVQALWQAPHVVAPARTTGDEPRWLVVGKLGDKHWTAVVAVRGDRTRIISVRRSRPEERQAYEEHSGHFSG
ncbi:MAG TPA: BrnT family toxin [Verrucomicrobiota bacterium]|nr:BrnT family toxin [Verrucomicrobiota bacterium]